jgi:hypothetical protein
MARKAVRLFFLSAGVLLLLTAAAKLLSSSGSMGILDYPDPVFLISYRHELPLAALIELAVAFVCFFGKQISWRAMTVASLASALIVYRVAAFIIRPEKMCPCLGTLTQDLHIAPKAANIAMLIILGYLFCGAYGTLLWLRKHSTTDMRVSGAAVA